MYSIEFSKKAEDQFDKLPLIVQGRIINSLERIRIRPYHFIKRKQGTPHFIFRVGNYRLILNVKNNELIIFVIEIGLRKNIYKR